jgi:hypothetical protein
LYAWERVEQAPHDLTSAIAVYCTVMESGMIGYNRVSHQGFTHQEDWDAAYEKSKNICEEFLLTLLSGEERLWLFPAHAERIAEFALRNKLSNPPLRPAAPSRQFLRHDYSWA